MQEMEFMNYLQRQEILGGRTFMDLFVKNPTKINQILKFEFGPQSA